jgi:hypothetical protein
MSGQGTGLTQEQDAWRITGFRDAETQRPKQIGLRVDLQRAYNRGYKAGRVYLADATAKGMDLRPVVTIRQCAPRKGPSFDVVFRITSVIGLPLSRELSDREFGYSDEAHDAARLAFPEAVITVVS